MRLSLRSSLNCPARSYRQACLSLRHSPLAFVPSAKPVVFAFPIPALSLSKCPKGSALKNPKTSCWIVFGFLKIPDEFGGEVDAV